MSDDRLVGSLDESAIAVIGMAGRFPGAANVEVLWKNIFSGVESVSPLCDEDLRSNGISDELLNDPSYVRAFAAIEDVHSFDGDYFNFSSQEVEYIDPQHRLFLETAVEALQNAGCDSHRYKGSIGVFGGANLNVHQLLMIREQFQSNGVRSAIRFLDRLDANVLAILGSDKDYLATRTSYKLNLRGPSIVVQTACSTSLVAVHLACQSLLSGECDIALAGGVSITNSSYRRSGYLAVEGMTSPDGHCRPFDARANGTVFGDGVGIIALKKVDRAVAEGDCIRAVIKGSAVNNDGSAKIGYTAPSVDAQAAVIVEALTVAGISPQSVSYVEAHGTGTPLGDPVEVAALTRAYGAATAGQKFCGIGSVKANVGHLNAAAGIAGLMKVVLALENKWLPPSINFETANPAIRFAGSPFYVVTQPTQWNWRGGPRRAGVSALGVGGTNAHVIVEEAPPRESFGSRRSTCVVALSARTSVALDASVADLAAHLRRHPEASMADVAHTLATGRTFHRCRQAVVCSDREEFLRVVESSDRRYVCRGAEDRGVTFFAFPGQGSQQLNMGRCLYAEEEVFRAAIDECAALLRPDVKRDIRELIWPRNGHGSAELLAETGIAQPVIFSISYAMAKLWMSWGVHPRSMIGHSLGELVAACIAEVFTLEQALSAVAARASLMQAMPRGAMLAVAAPAEELRKHLDRELSVAAMNAPDTCVVSGSSEAILALAATLTAQGLMATRLETSHAFHSPMMAPMVEPFVERLRRMSLKPPTIRFISNVTGTWITTEQATDPSYWGRHVLNPVRFAEGIKTVLAEAPTAVLEVGPGRALTTLGRHNSGADNTVDFISSLPEPNGTSDESQSIARALAQLWVRGAAVEWEELYRSERRLKVPLPTYPFERKEYWISSFGPRDVEQDSGPKVGERQGPEPTMASEMFRMLSWKYVNRCPSQDVAAIHSRSCLVFAADDRLSGQIVEALRDRGAIVSVVSIAERFETLADGRFTVCPAEPEHFARLWSELAGAGRTPQTIIYAWSLLREEADCERKLDRTFHGLTHLLQAMGSSVQDKPFELTVMVAETYDILGNETVLPLAATALGPCLSASSEYQHVRWRYVDVSRDGVEVAGQVVDDLDDWSVGPIVAYRGTRRWIPLTEAMTFEPRESKPPLRRDGVYVITGGLGEIGLEVAAAFAEKTRVKLALIGRSAFPDRNEWDACLQGGSPQRTGDIVRKIRAIEEKGADVMVVRADVGDPDSMRAALGMIRERFGGIHGIVHMAGLLDLGLIADKSRADVAPVLSAKIAGARLLDRLLQGLELDFFVLFSSIEALTGGAGLAGYRAANAYLDAFARSNVPNNAGRIMSIDWGGWGEIGMAARFRAARKMLRDENGLSTREGTDALFRVLQGRARQVIVSKGSERLWLANAARPAGEQIGEAIAGGKRRYSRPNLPTPYVEPRSELERVVAEAWGDVLRVETVGIDDDFFELGGHSLLALQLVPRLQRQFQIKLSILEFFEATTVAAGARIIESKLIEEAGAR